MDRYAAVALFLVGSAALAKPPAKKPAATRSLHVRAIDLERRFVLVELSGMSRPPAPNLFTFTDERDRHYVAMGVSCDAPEESSAAAKARTCQLEMPAGYERHKLVRLELHLGNLHSRTIAANEAEVEAAWTAALATRVVPSPSPLPRAPKTGLVPSPKPASLAKPSPSPRPHR